MSKLPQIILDSFKSRVRGPVVTTVNEAGITNSIYATCVSIYDEKKILVANNFFSKTLENIKNSCKGNFLFLTKEGKAYQLKGTYHYYTSGDMFDDMKSWNGKDLPGLGVAVLDVEEIYSGEEKIEF
jgi:uncharacterized protein